MALDSGTPPDIFVPRPPPDSKIRLCGATCDAVKADTGGRVDVVLGCPIQGPD